MVTAKKSTTRKIGKNVKAVEEKTSISAKKTAVIMEKSTSTKKIKKIAQEMAEPTKEVDAKKTVSKKKLVTVRKASIDPTVDASIPVHPNPSFENGNIKPKTTINPNAPWPFSKS